MDMRHSVHSSIDGRLGSAAKNIYVQVFTWMYVFISLNYLSRSGIAQLLNFF